MCAASLEFEQPRFRMVVQHLRGRGIHDERVLDVMRRVPRELFVPETARNLAYADQALQIDCDQTISQPYMVALMTEALAITGDERVLEIGTGSGYQTSVLAELSAEVFSVERHTKLHREARSRLDALGYRNIQFMDGDGSAGWAEHAPFDRIVITCASSECSTALWSQLNPGGLLVGPFGTSNRQMLQTHSKRTGGRVVRNLVRCRFVPLVNDVPKQS